jgi:RNA polymerase sigma factor (sigma-70 family)
MGRGQLQSLLRHIRRFAGPPGAVRTTDSELLEQFLDQRDETAFEVLVWRHGSMIFGLCRRLLRNEQDAEDAFQATFLTLVRKGKSIGKREALGSWLHKVAFRIALAAKERSLRRSLRERAAVFPPFSDAAQKRPEERELAFVLDDEINRLPEKYRAAVVLCYLQGRTTQQAAHQLCCPRGTVATRLAWARERLRKRLTQRGVGLSIATLATVLTPKGASAAISAGLVEATIRTTLLLPAAAIPAQVAALSQGVLKTMMFSKLQIALSVILAMCVAGTGSSVVTYRLVTQEAGAAENDPQPPPSLSAPAKRGDMARMPSQREGVLLMIGTETKPGENVPADQVLVLKVGGQERRYRRLKEGDRVEEGQLLARVDDRVALAELAISEARLQAAKKDETVAELTAAELRERYATNLNLKKVQGVSADELRGSLFLAERAANELKVKHASTRVAELELQKAKAVVETYEIRSRVRGTIRVIYKYPGEAVKSFEPVFEIRVERDK